MGELGYKNHHDHTHSWSWNSKCNIFMAQTYNISHKMSISHPRYPYKRGMTCEAVFEKNKIDTFQNSSLLIQYRGWMWVITSIMTFLCKLQPSPYCSTDELQIWICTESNTAFLLQELVFISKTSQVNLIPITIKKKKTFILQFRPCPSSFQDRKVESFLC